MSGIEELIEELCPDGVAWVSLSKVGSLLSGLSGKSKGDFVDGNARYATYKNVFSHLALDQQASDFVKVGESERQHRLHCGDVVFTGSSESFDEVGYSSVVIGEPVEPLYLNSFCFILRFEEEQLLLPEFSKYLFRSRQLRVQIKKTANGVTRINISKKRFLDVRIPVPPLEIQREIVRILDEFTQLEAELEAELEKRRQQYEYYRDQLLTFSDGVRWTTLGEAAVNLDSMREPITRGKRTPGKVPYYGASGIVDYVASYIFDGDYLLVSEDGANLLARSTPIAFSISGKSWVNNHAHVLKFESYASRRFVEIYLNSIDLSPFISGAAQPKLNKANLNSIPVPDPEYSEKAQKVALLDKFDALVNDLSIGLPAELNARRKQYEYYRDQLLTFREAV